MFRVSLSHRDTMFSRKYLQSHLLAGIVAFTVLSACCVVTVLADESENVIVPSNSQNETDSGGIHSEGSETGTTTASNEAFTSTESSATPALSDSLFSGDGATTDLPNSEERPTVTILPSPISLPAMIITATKVTLGHRVGAPEPSTTDSNEVPTENPTVAVVEESVTDSPSHVATGGEHETEKQNNDSNELIADQDAMPSTRHSRYHRFHDNYVPGEEGHHHREHHLDQSPEYFRELEVDGGESYGDFNEDNEIPEQLPTPMALINPNGEGNNPPLEDDFAEAFKKVNGNGKRRRFRGGRGRGRMKVKKINDTNDSNASTSTASEQEAQKSGTSEWSSQPTTESPHSVSPKFKRYRSTTPNTGMMMGRSSAPSTTPSSVSTETPDGDEGGNGPVVKNGPKPMILHSSYDDSSSSSSITNDVVTPMPQIEKPGNGGHTEKISTYFFSTPSPSARLRLRQKIRDNLPPSSTTVTPSTTSTPTESFTEASIKGSDLWKNEFSEFPQNPFFAEVTHESPKFKIPEFVPMSLGIEQDDRRDHVENSLNRPDPAEKKTYSMSGYDSTYSSSSTTPKSHKVRRPTSESYTKETKSRVPPTSETERATGTEYYGQGSNTEPSTTFSSAHRQTTGSHYDRTKDRVVFYNDSPYSAQHSSTPSLLAGGAAPTPSLDSTPGPSSQTVGSLLSVSDGANLYENPLTAAITVDHHHYVNEPNQLYTRGQVYPEEVIPHLDSTFKNGPPDSSHIHSPNIIENAQPQTLATTMPSSTEDLQHLRHTHNSHEDTYSHPSLLEESHHHPLHPSLARPDGSNGIYGTVEEVPAHGNSPYDHLRHNPFEPHHPHHSMHPHPPGPVPYPFGAEYPGGPPLHAPHAMSHPMSYPMPPPHLSHHHGEHPLPTHPVPPPPLPPPHMHAHVHHPQPGNIHNSFAQPPYEMHSSPENDNNQHSHLHSNNLADSHSEMSHSPHDIAQMFTQSHGDSQSQHDGHPSPTVSSPTAAVAPSPPEFPASLLSSNAAHESAQEPQTDYNGPPPQPPPQMDHNFPPHSHTMASQADYEPANPPLPHDHPFHKNFIPFPPQDLMMPPQSEHSNGHESNSLGASDAASGAYHPGIVENDPTGRPASSFEASPLIPSKFTPIPDDVKESELYNSYASKPYDGASHHGTHHSADPTESSQSSNQVPELSSHNTHHSPSSDVMSAYLDPDNPNSPYHQLPNQHSSSPGGHSGSDQAQPDHNGYSGPVNEIHSGIYQHPNSLDRPGGDQSESYQSHQLYDNHNEHSPGLGGYNMHGGEHEHDQGSDIKTGGFSIHDKPSHHDEHHNYNNYDDQSHHTGPPHNIQSSIRDAKKEKKQRQQAAFSNTPYVLMFPQLIPEEKMRPSPPSLLSKEIPVIQASSMNDFTSSGEKPPLGPGFQAVPVHPRHQMYQVLAKTHYEKMMERYKESKKKPPSAIYTPYGILVPVGTNVDAAASMSHSVFAKPRIPPKFRGEKSLLNALLGSPSNNHGRIHPPMMSNRLTKIFEYEPAIDVLAEKLAMKIVNAQQALKQKKIGGKAEEKSDDSLEKPKEAKEEQMTMTESKVHAMVANPELKDYLKGVLKGHLTEMVETSVTSMEDRRPVTLSTKLLNSFFRKSRINLGQPQLKGPSPTPMLMQSSGSMIMPQKVPPPPGMLSQQSGPHLHSGMGHPYPPPMSMGQSGLLGTIRRLFSFAPPEMRYDNGMAPNFGGRTMFTANGSHLPYIDGPSPRSSHFAPQIILPQPHMVHQYPPMQQQMKSRMATVPAPPQQTMGSSNGPSRSSGISITGTTTPKPSKKKKKTSSISSSSYKKQSTSEDRESSRPGSTWQSSSSSLSRYKGGIENIHLTTSSTTTTTTSKPVVMHSKGTGYYHRSNNGSSSSNMVSISNPNNAISRHQVINKKTGVPNGNSGTTFGGSGDMTSSSSSLSKVKSDSHRDSGSTMKTEVVLNKRLGISSSGTASSSSSSADSTKDKAPTPTSSKPLDMFQTILGSTRSVLNYFKSSEGRKSSGDAPTVLEPRSAPANPVVIEETETEESASQRKRRSILHHRKTRT